MLVVDWLQEANTLAVARMMGLSRNAMDGIMQRAAKRGLARRSDQTVSQIGVDEISFRKRHEDVTIVSDTQSGTVLHVGEDRKKTSLSTGIPGFLPHSWRALKVFAWTCGQHGSAPRQNIFYEPIRRCPLVDFM